MTAAMLVEVQIVERGTSATANASSGASTISVEDLTQFDEDGGWLDICGRQYQYASINETTSQITLVGTLTANVDEFDPVLVVAGGEVVRDWLGVVDLGEGDNVTVPIPFTMRAQLPEALYDPPIPVGVSADLLELTDLPGRTPVLQGGYLDPTTIPDQEPLEPPAASPAIEAHGMPSSVLLRALDPVAQTDVIEYHVSPTAFVPTPGDVNTLIATTRSAVFVATELANGDKLNLNTNYYFAAIARNSQGTAPPSATITAQLDPDAVEAVIAANVYAGFILAGLIQVGNITIDPDDGIQIPLTNGGLISLPADGSPAQFLRVILQATQLLVEDNLEIRGALNRIAGTLALSAGVVTPTTAPTVTAAWDDPATYLNLVPTTYWTENLADDGTRWVTIRAADDPGSKIIGFHKTTGVESTLATVANISSLTRAGTTWYLLDNSGATGLVRTYNSSWAAGTTFNAPATPANCKILGIAHDPTTNLLYYSYRRTTDNKFLVYSSTLAGGSPTAVFTTADAPGSQLACRSMWVGSADFGAQRFVFPLHTPVAGAAVKIYTSAGARATTQEWANPNSEATRGVYYDGTNFRTLTGAAVPQHVWKLSPVVTATTRSVKWTYYDSDSGGGTHETAMSTTAAAFTQNPRQWMKVVTPAPPDLGNNNDPNAIRHYIQNGGSGSYYRQADVAAAPWTAYYGTPSTAGATSVSSPDFSGVANPGLVQSASTDGTGPLVQLKGDGTWRLKPFSFNPSTGVLAREDDTGWIDLTLDSGNQAVAGATPAYRIVGDQVFLRGKVEKTSGSWGTGSTVTFVSSTPLPAAARPSMRLDYQAAGQAAVASVKLLINTSGSIQIVTGTTVPSYVDLSCAVWAV